MNRWSPLLALCACIPSTVHAQSMTDRARAAADASRAKTSLSDALRQNYVTPGMAGQPIATIDGSRTFAPRINCQKTASLLEVLVQPGSTGDIGTVRISQDTDLDGSFDKAATLGVPVSGICANGIVSCAPGTWSQCHYFKWGLDTAKALKLSEVEIADLAGCYCVNNSCGTNLVWGNLAEVLKDLGGGMVGALTTADPRIGVAQAQLNGPVIDYVGAQATACAADPGLGQTAYRANPAAIQGDAASFAAGNSIFQMVKASPAGLGKAEQTRSCGIEREIEIKTYTFDDIVGASGSFASVTSCGTDCRRYRIYGLGTCDAQPSTYTGVFDIRRPDRLVSAKIVDIAADDWLQVRVNGASTASLGPRPWLTDAIPSGDCKLEAEREQAVDIDITDAMRAGATTVGARVRSGGIGRWGWVDVEIQVDASCETSERLVDLCSGYAADTACRLRDEDVDGVTTFRNGVNTGLRPLPQTRLFGTGACAFQYTRDFFQRERTYSCVLDLGAVPQPDLSRGAYIIDHSTETLLADQLKTPSGVAQTSRPFGLPDRGSVPACEALCKTRAPKVNTAAAVSGVMGTQQNDPAGWDTFYHACEVDNVCPVGAGEEIVTACGCLDDFPEAAVMMQSVRLAGADMVCTSAVP